jgi:hypothetical protein
MMRSTWIFTVPGEIFRVLAISLLVRPSATFDRTSRSRIVSVSSALLLVCGLVAARRNSFATSGPSKKASP